MNIDTTTHALPADCYFTEKVAKSLIVIHFTAGTTASGAANYWKALKNKISAPYLIDTDGKIYSCYPPEYWSYHLGIKGTHAHDKRSIAIEVVNPGPLVQRGDNMCFWPGNFTAKYCNKSETGKYVTVPDYRGYKDYATFPKVQLQAVKELVDKLCVDFKIPQTVISNPGNFQPGDAAKHVGIATHSCFRADKFDAGPAFDWNIFNPVVS